MGADGHYALLKFQLYTHSSFCAEHQASSRAAERPKSDKPHHISFYHPTASLTLQCLASPQVWSSSHHSQQPLLTSTPVLRLANSAHSMDTDMKLLSQYHLPTPAYPISLVVSLVTLAHRPCTSILCNFFCSGACNVFLCCSQQCIFSSRNAFSGSCSIASVRFSVL